MDWPRGSCCLLALVRFGEPRPGQAHGEWGRWAWSERESPCWPSSTPPHPCPPQGPSRNLLLNGKSYPTKVRLIRGGSLPPVKRRRMNWIDAPDDVFYMATEETRWGQGRGRPSLPAPPPLARPAPCPRAAAAVPTGRFANCCLRRRPSVPPAGPTSPSPCARARRCLCGPPCLHP